MFKFKTDDRNFVFSGALTAYKLSFTYDNDGVDKFFKNHNYKEKEVSK